MIWAHRNKIQKFIQTTGPKYEEDDLKHPNEEAWYQDLLSSFKDNLSDDEVDFEEKNSGGCKKKLGLALGIQQIREEQIEKVSFQADVCLLENC